MPKFGACATMPFLGAPGAMGRRRYQHPSVRKTSSKDKSAQRWYFRARVDHIGKDGKLEREESRIYLGNVSELTKREADQRRDDILAQKINKPETFLPTQISFGFILDKWIANNGSGIGTIKAYESVVNAHLRPRWGSVRICDISPEDVHTWLMLLARTCTQKTLGNIKTRFGQAWKYAIHLRYTREVCPLVGMPEIRQFGKAPRAAILPTLEQFLQLLYLLDEPYRSIVIVCTFTGLRIGEALALTTAQLQSDVAIITRASVRATGKLGPPKTANSVRKIPMKHLHGEIVIPHDSASEDRPYFLNYTTVLKAIKTAAKTIGLDYHGFGCHTFRKMHNTMFRRLSDGNVQLSMKQLGHANETTNDLYYIPDDSDVAKRAEIVSSMIENVMQADA